MNQEMMALYREKKVNPAAGCVADVADAPDYDRHVGRAAGGIE